MKVIITGGLGFLAQQLCRRILALGEIAGPEDERQAVEEVVLFDRAGTAPAELKADARVRIVTGDITDSATCRALVDRDGILVFHLASIMSGQGEADFDLCMKVNLEGTQAVLEACRKRSGCRLVFTSSGACFGERAAGPETDGTKLLPHTTYGMTKAVCELLINDYSRRGFLDGRVARLPTVLARPEPNAGLPQAWMAVIREPLMGRDVVLNVTPDLRHAVCGFRSLVRNLLHLAQLPEAALAGSSDRAMNLPCLSVTCAELFDAVKSVVQDPSKLGSVTYAPDRFVMEKLRTFHSNMDAGRALSLGMVRDGSPAALAVDFAAEYLDAALLKPVLEIDEEPRHTLLFSNTSVRVFRVEFPAGQTTLMHSHRVDALYFFFNANRLCNQKLAESAFEDVVEEGEIRYGDHCGNPLVHKITALGPKPMFCLDIELMDCTRAGLQEPPAKRRVVESPWSQDLKLVKERPGARVHSLRVPAGGHWKAELPLGKFLLVVKDGARTQGSLGDGLLKPADVFFKEGPQEVSLEVLGRRELVLWIAELLS